MFSSSQGPNHPENSTSAQNAYMSNADVPDVDFLASMGTYGKDDQNIARDLISKFCKGHDNIMPHPYIVSLPVQVKVHADCEKRRSSEISICFFLISGLLYWMHLITFGGLFLVSKTWKHFGLDIY